MALQWWCFPCDTPRGCIKTYTPSVCVCKHLLACLSHSKKENTGPVESYFSPGCNLLFPFQCHRSYYLSQLLPLAINWQRYLPIHGIEPRGKVLECQIGNRSLF